MVYISEIYTGYLLLDCTPFPLPLTTHHPTLPSPHRCTVFPNLQLLLVLRFTQDTCFWTSQFRQRNIWNNNTHWLSESSFYTVLGQLVFCFNQVLTALLTWGTHNAHLRSLTHVRVTDKILTPCHSLKIGRLRASRPLSSLASAVFYSLKSWRKKSFPPFFW